MGRRRLERNDESPESVDALLVGLLAVTVASAVGLSLYSPTHAEAFLVSGTVISAGLAGALVGHRVLYDYFLTLSRRRRRGAIAQFLVLVIAALASGLAARFASGLSPLPWLVVASVAVALFLAVLFALGGLVIGVLESVANAHEE